MIQVRALTEAERGELKRRARREVGRIAARMRAILLSSRGDSVLQIASIFECDEASVRRWIERVEAEGIAALCDRPGSGRPPRADATARDPLRRALESGPAEGAQPGYWTVLSLGLHVWLATGRRLSASSLRRGLHGLGYGWRRPRPVLPGDRIRRVVVHPDPYVQRLLIVEHADLGPVLRGRALDRLTLHEFGRRRSRSPPILVESPVDTDGRCAAMDL